MRKQKTCVVYLEREIRLYAEVEVEASSEDAARYVAWTAVDSVASRGGYWQEDTVIDAKIIRVKETQ